jgi:hypothetical protein
VIFICFIATLQFLFKTKTAFFTFVSFFFVDALKGKVWLAVSTPKLSAIFLQTGRNLCLAPGVHIFTSKYEAEKIFVRPIYSNFIFYLQHYQNCVVMGLWTLSIVRRVKY